MEPHTNTISTVATPVEQMFKVGAHYGYSRSKRHPSAKDMLFGSKNKVDIIDLEKTMNALRRAEDFARDLGTQGKTLLFVGTKHEARKCVESSAVTLGMPYVNARWIGGTLTNFSEIKRRIAHYLDLSGKRARNELTMYTKKERLLFDRELANLTSNFGGIISLTKLPGALFIVDHRHEKNALAEAHTLQIPVIALSSTDGNLTEVEYPIPANDATLASIAFFINRIAQAYREGRNTNVQ